MNYPIGNTRTAGFDVNTKPVVGKPTLMVVNTIGHLAEAGWHHPDLTVSYAFVTVKLMNHAAKGITDKDFELAKKFEEVIQWQPGAEEDAILDGTPEDPRFKYIKYD